MQDSGLIIWKQSSERDTEKSQKLHNEVTTDTLATLLKNRRQIIRTIVFSKSTIVLSPGITPKSATKPPLASYGKPETFGSVSIAFQIGRVVIIENSWVPFNGKPLKDLLNTSKAPPNQHLDPHWCDSKKIKLSGVSSFLVTLPSFATGKLGSFIDEGGTGNFLLKPFSIESEFKQSVLPRHFHKQSPWREIRLNVEPLTINLTVYDCLVLSETGYQLIMLSRNKASKLFNKHKLLLTREFVKI